MLLANPRNTVLLVLGCVVVTVALLDDEAPNRLIENAEAVAQRRQAEDAAGQAGGTDFGAGPAGWNSNSVNGHTDVASNDGVPAARRELDQLSPALAATPAPVISGQSEPFPTVVGARPVPGMRERSAPLRRNLAEEDTRNMAEDLRRVLG
jgi:hypothetical protein